MNRSKRQSLKGESGAIAIIVAVAMVALLTAVALVIDLGGLYDHDRELQTAADAGALAGAQELIISDGDTGAATAKTQEYVSTNTAPDSSVVEANLDAWAPVVDAESVTVDLREDHVAFTFAQVFGKSEGAVRAHAKAEGQIPDRGGEPVPCGAAHHESREVPLRL